MGILEVGDGWEFMKNRSARTSRRERRSGLFFREIGKSANKKPAPRGRVFHSTYCTIGQVPVGVKGVTELFRDALRYAAVRSMPSWRSRSITARLIYSEAVVRFLSAATLSARGNTAGIISS